MPWFIDGEAVHLGVDGVSDFNGLHSRNRLKGCSSYCSTREQLA
jgi:hypothetical protein